jgi:hypothetical protein
MAESVIIGIWSVPSGREQEMIDALLDAFQELRLSDGFIEAGALQNREKTKVAWYLRMRFAENGNGAAEREGVRQRIRALESIGGSRVDAFERVCVIVPPSETGPTEVSYGSF